MVITWTEVKIHWLYVCAVDMNLYTPWRILGQPYWYWSSGWPFTAYTWHNIHHCCNLHRPVLLMLDTNLQIGFARYRCTYYWRYPFITSQCQWWYFAYYRRKWGNWLTSQHRKRDRCKAFIFRKAVNCRKLVHGQC